MYKTILVTLDSTPTDQAIIEHVKQLAKVLRRSPARFAGLESGAG